MGDRADYFDDQSRRDSVQADLDQANLAKPLDQARIDKLTKQLAEWDAALAVHP